MELSRIFSFLQLFWNFMRQLLLYIISGLLLFSFQFAYADVPKKWTFLIFLNGDNGLDPDATQNLLAMEKVGSNDQVNIVVQWASLSAGKTVRLLVKKSTDPTHVTSPILQDLGLVDMGNYKNLQDFIQWGVTNFPADHYFVDVWDHGSGWHLQHNQHFHSKQNTLNDISWDEISGNWITTEQLGSVMTYAANVMGHRVDVYGSDACQMAMVEVANEMSTSVDYFAGSEFVEPAASWPYAEFFRHVEARPNLTADQVSKLLTKEYVRSYEGGSGGRAQVTFSAFQMDKLNRFNTAFKKMSDEIRTLAPSEKAKVLSAAQNAQQFFENDYRDVGDLLKKLKQAKITGISKADITEVQFALDEFVIANADTKNFRDSTGLSIWFPVTTNRYNQYADRYSHLDFNQATDWNASLNYILQGTH